MKNQFLIFLLILSGCSPSEKKDNATEANAEPSSLDVKEFKEMLATEKDAVLLDVRTPSEVAEGMISGAMVIDFTAPDFTDKISTLDKGKSYFVYCKAGGRSSRAVEQMKGAGFKKVYNLEGGYDAWVQDANVTP